MYLLTHLGLQPTHRANEREKAKLRHELCRSKPLTLDVLLFINIVSYTRLRLLQLSVSSPDIEARVSHEAMIYN